MIETSDQDWIREDCCELPSFSFQRHLLFVSMISCLRLGSEEDLFPSGSWEFLVLCTLLVFFINNLPSAMNTLHYEIYPWRVFNISVAPMFTFLVAHTLGCAYPHWLLTKVLTQLNGAILCKQKLEKDFNIRICPPLLPLGSTATILYSKDSYQET